MAIGLVAILIAVGVMVWIMHAVELPAAKQALDVQKKVKPQAQQMAGVGADGEDARNSISLDEERSGGRMDGVVVTKIDADGPMAKYFGLKAGDSIIEIAPQGGVLMPVKEMDSPQTAKDHLLSSFQNSQQIVVMRQGQKVTLPAAPPSKRDKPAGDPLQSQLNSLQQQKVPTH